MPVVDVQIEREAQPGRTVTRAIPMTAGRRAIAPLGASWTDAEGRDLNPDDLGFATLDRMRAEPTIATGLRIIVTTILRQIAQARVECDDPSLRRFLEATLIESGLFYATIKSSLHGVWAGMQACEKVWAVEELDLSYEIDDGPDGPTTGSAWKGPALIVKELRELAPTTISSIKRRVAPAGSTARTDAEGRPYDGSFDGFYWHDDQYNPDADANGDVWVQPQKAFLYTHDSEFGNLWGRPRIRNAYANHHWLEYTMKAWVSWEETKVVPHKIARYPEGVSLVDGQELDNSEIAADFGDALDNSTVAVIPSTRDDKGAYEWDLDEKPNTDKTATWKETAIYHEDRELRAMFVPNKVFENQEVGSYSAINAYQDFFLLTQDTLLDDLVAAGNKYLTRPQAVANFGNKIPDARILVPGLTDAKQARLAAIVDALLLSPDFIARIDSDAVAEHADIPLKTAPAPVESLGGTLPGPAAAPPTPPIPAGPAPSAAPAAGPPAGGAATPPAAPAPPAGGLVAAADTASIISAFADELAAGTIGLADVISLATGFDPTKWTITPDPISTLRYAVHYATGPFAGKRLTGFAAAKVIDSWQKASASSAKKAATAAGVAERKAAAAAKRNATAAATAERKSTAEQTRATRAAEAEARRQEREALKQEKEIERQQAAAQRKSDAEQKAAERKTAREQSAVLAQARNERSQMEISTRRQDPAGVSATLRARGWEAVGSTYTDRQAAEQAAHAAAAGAADHTFTVVATKGGFIVARKPTAKITVAKTSPNVAASDTAPAPDAGPPQTPEAGPPGPPPGPLDLVEAAAARLRPLFITELDPAETEGD